MNRLLFEKPTQVRFSEQIAGQIESMILGEQLRPGDKLPAERQLAIQFGVSRTAVRESIKLLEERGLVEALDGRGAFVTAPKLENAFSSLHLAYRMQDCSVDDLHEARWCVESTIARLAATRATAEDITRVEEAMEMMDEALDNPAGYALADLKFHAAMAAATHNPLLVAIAGPLVELIQTLSAMTFKTGSILERHHMHKQIFERIKSHDAIGAEESMHRHLELTRQTVEKSDKQTR